MLFRKLRCVFNTAKVFLQDFVLDEYGDVIPNANVAHPDEIIKSLGLLDMFECETVV